MALEVPKPQEILSDFAVDCDFHALFPHAPTRGRVAQFGRADSAEELILAVKSAIHHEMPFRVVGSAESLLVGEEGYSGLIIQNAAKALHLVPDLSQVIVDVGMPMQNLITSLATAGYGGLIHLLPLGGTVGGALVTDSHVGKRNLLDITRSITVIMPPTKAKPEVRVVRFRSEWLRNTRISETGTRIMDALRKEVGGVAPVIVSAQIQLTSLRHDELERQLVAAEKHLQQIGARQDEYPYAPLVTQPNGDIVVRNPSISLKEIEKELGIQFAKSGMYRAKQKKPLFGTVPMLSTAQLLTVEERLASYLNSFGAGVIPAHELVQ